MPALYLGSEVSTCENLPEPSGVFHASGGKLHLTSVRPTLLSIELTNNSKRIETLGRSKDQDGDELRGFPRPYAEDSKELV